MKTKFPQTLEAAKRAEGAQWAIGEALLKEARKLERMRKRMSA